jgi:hypothetical protein
MPRWRPLAGYVLTALAANTNGKFVEKPNGLIVPVEPAKIIKSVYVSPSAAPPVHEVVGGLLQTYGVDVPVLQSDVNAPPPF